MKILFQLVLLTFIIGCSGSQAQKSSVSRVNNEEFATLMNDANAQIVDVRTTAEFNSGHIQGAKLINIMESDFKAQIETLDKTKPVLVYCAVGGRSYRASQIMKAMGSALIYDLKDGIKGWSKDGYEVVK
jgi:rhodanese-related sulfurtransferase